MVTTNGASSTVAQINAAIASAPAGTYVLLPPGTYAIDGNINMQGGVSSGGNVTLRGSGAMQTTLQMSGSVNIQLGGSSFGGWARLTSASSNFTQRGTSVVVTSGSGTPAVGNIASFTQCDTGFSAVDGSFTQDTPTRSCTGSHVDNGGLFICGLDNGVCQTDTGSNSTNPHFQQQTVRITSVSGTGPYTVGFTPGLYMPNWAYANSATLVWENPSFTGVGMGLEDMTVVYQNGANQQVFIHNAYASWVKGVRFVNSPLNGQLQLGGYSKNSLAVNNYFFPQDTANTSVNIAIAQENDSDDLILNNIAQGGLVEGLGMESGDVIAFNYIRDLITTYYQPATFRHHASPSFMLLEGNQTGSALDDGTWGSHDLDTFFRNDLSCWDSPYDIPSVTGQGLLIDSFARFDNLVGNAIGSSKCTTYEGTTNYIFSFGSGNDPLAKITSMRWGNVSTVTQVTDTPANSGIRFLRSEVPLSLGANAALNNFVPSTTNLPASFFMNVTAHLSGGTGLSWWRVCTNWNTFPADCAAYQTPPFPTSGPDVIFGPYVNGHAYDIPSAIAYKYLPIDTTYQHSYSITSSRWSGGKETLTISGLPGNAQHIMGGFQISGAPAACNPSGGELVMTGSTTTTFSYALASDPNTSCGGTVKWPDIRQFDEAVYQNDSGGNAAVPPPSGLIAVVQ